MVHLNGTWYDLHTYLHYLCSTQVGPFHYQTRNRGDGMPSEYKVEVESDYHQIACKKRHPIKVIKLWAVPTVERVE